MKINEQKTMIYTPKYHIPIGEALIADNGEYALRFKKAGEKEYEIMTISMLMSKLAQINSTALA